MSNLLEKASILTTPTAYDDGKILSVKPSIVLGEELVTNGDFSDGTNGWGASGEATISVVNGELVVNVTGGGGGFVRTSNIPCIDGRTYIVSIDYRTGTYVGDVLPIIDNNSLGLITPTSETQTKTWKVVATGSSFQLAFVRSAAYTGTIYYDNVSVKEAIDGDFDFTRNSSATRVNAQGLVEDVQILSSNLVQNGDFSEEGAEEVSNGDFSQEGSELITNGNFATDSDWNKQTSNWTIVNGYAVCDGLQTSNSSLFQDVAVVNGKSYKIDFTITDSANDLNLILGATTIGQYGAGTHSIYVTKDSNASARIFFQATASNAFQGSLDNVSVKEVGQDWDIEDTWTIGDGVANGNGANGSGEELVSNSSSLPLGTYKIVFEIKDYVSGSVNPYLSGSTETFSGNGVYTTYKTTTTLSSIKFRGTNFNGSITNISVKEVGQDWILGTGWSIGEDKATVDNTLNANLDQFISGFSGKKVKVSFEISDLSSGGILVGDIVNPGAYNATSNGIHTFNYTATNSTFRVRAYGNPCSITNITILEITDDTNLPRINYDGFSYQDTLGSELVTNGLFDTDTDWIKDDSWTISGGKANYNYISGRNLNSSTATLIVGRIYQIKYDILDYVSGSVENSSAETQISNNSNGTYTEVFTARYTFLRFRGSTNGEFSIDNVSVKEVTGQEVVPDSGVGSWLFEPQSTNLIIQSENLSSVDWTKSLVTVSANDIASPSGEVNASLIQETVYTSSIPSLKTTNNIPISTGKHTLSFYVKNNNGRYLGISFGNNTNRIRTTFDFDTETFKTPLFNGITEGEVSYTTIGDYYRILITANFTSSIAGLVFIMPIATDTYPFYAFQNSDNRSFYLWGVQVEASSFATSYIPTNGSTVTRLQDAAFGAGSSDLINSTEGVLYAEIAALANDGTYRLMSLNDGTTTNRMYLGYMSTDNFIRIRLTSGAVTQVDFVENLSNATSFNKVAFKYKENDFALWINGIKVATDTSGLTPVTLTDLSFNAGSTNFFGKTKCVAVFKEALTDAELTCLTTI